MSALFKGRLLRIHSGEGRPAALLTGLLFFPMAGMAIGSPGIESLFLMRVGVASLPYAYLLLGAATVVVTLLVSVMVARVSGRVLYQMLPAILGILLLAARVLIWLRFDWIYLPLFLGIYVVWTLQNMFTWGTAGMVCTTRQAKRLFPLFAAGGIVGNALGGLVTRLLVPLLGAENLVLVWAALLLVSFALVRRLLRGTVAVRPRARPASILGLVQGFRSLRELSLMRWLVVVTLLLGSLYFLLAFPFSRAVVDRFSGEDRLAGFLGLFQGLTTAVALLVSLLAASRLFARIGFIGVIFVFALIYLAGFGILAAAGVGFAALVAIRFVQMTWLMGVGTTAAQAVYNVLPASRREHSRMLAEGISRRIGTAVAGGILMAGAAAPRMIPYLGVALAAGAVVALWMARRAYARALVEALRAGRAGVFSSEEEPFGGYLRDAAAVAALVSVLGEPQAQRRRIAAEILGHVPTPQAAAALAGALDDPDASVRALALRALGRGGAVGALLEIATCLGDREPAVRAQAARELGELSPYSRGLVGCLRPLLADDVAEVRAAAASVLLRRTRDGEAAAVVEAMLGSSDGAERVLALRCLPEGADSRSVAPAFALLRDADPQVRAAALGAAARLDATRGLAAAAAALGDAEREVRETAALELSRGGPAALGVLLEAVGDPAREEEALRALAALPVKVNPRPLREHARRRLADMLRYGRLSEQLASRAEGCFVLASREAAVRARECGLLAVRAAGVADGVEGIRIAADSIDVRDPELASDALEVLESLGWPQVARPVLALLEGETVAAGAARSGTPSGRDGSLAALRLLMSDPDPWLRACAALAAGEEPGLRGELERLAGDGDALVRQTACRALGGLRRRDPRNEGEGMDTLSTLSAMERILFLREVPLFSTMGPQELRRLADICSEEQFEDGELIALQGAPGEEMYIILSGEVRIVVNAGPAAREVAMRGPGEYVGEMAVLSRAPRMANMAANGQVRVLRIGRREFEQILRERPDASLAVIRVLCDRLREAQAGAASSGPAR